MNILKLLCLSSPKIVFVRLQTNNDNRNVPYVSRLRLSSLFLKTKKKKIVIRNLLAYLNEKTLIEFRIERSILPSWSDNDTSTRRDADSFKEHLSHARNDRRWKLTVSPADTSGFVKGPMHFFYHGFLFLCWPVETTSFIVENTSCPASHGNIFVFQFTKIVQNNLTARAYYIWETKEKIR